MIRILHISDLHFGKAGIDQDIVLSSFHSFTVDGSEKAQKNDIIVFSGDLVNAGDNEDTFRNAYDALISKLSSSLRINEKNIVICPGNHDIDRNLVRKKGWVESGLSTYLRDRDSINSFIDNHWELDLADGSQVDAFERLGPFYKTIWQADAGADFTNLFVNIHKIVVEGISVGVCAFNTAWRCTGEPGDADRARLVLGERAIDRALLQMKDCDLRLAVFHHPTDWLLEDDRTAVETRLHMDFDLFMYGHTHSNEPHYRSSTSGGAIHSQTGCLYSSREYFNGFSEVELCPEQSSARVRLLEYSDKRREFCPAERIIKGGQIDYPFIQGNSARNQSLAFILASARSAVRKLANEHVRLSLAEGEPADIYAHFACPPFHVDGGGALSDLGGEDANDIELDAIILGNANVLMWGRPESGKTTIAHYVAVRASEGNIDVPRLPLYARFVDFKRGSDVLWRAVRPYASEISDGRITRSLLEKLPLLILVDDIDLNNTSQVEFIGGIVKKTENARWFFLVNESGYHSLDRGAIEKRLGSLDIFSIPEQNNKSIRKLAANWVNRDIEDEETDNLVKGVIEHIGKTGLPRTGYVVSLIMWTLRNRSKGELINEAVLIENIIEYLLDKMDFQGALRREFDFPSRVAVLQHLAAKFKENDAVQNINQVLSWVVDFFEEKGLRFDASAVVNNYIRSGILLRIEDQVSFRYTRFRDYFLSGYLRDNEDKKETC